MTIFKSLPAVFWDEGGFAMLITEYVSHHTQLYIKCSYDTLSIADSFVFCN